MLRLFSEQGFFLAIYFAVYGRFFGSLIVVDVIDIVNKDQRRLLILWQDSTELPLTPTLLVVTLLPVLFRSRLRAHRNTFPQLFLCNEYLESIQHPP